MNKRKLSDLLARKALVGDLGALDFLIDLEKRRRDDFRREVVHVAMITDSNFVGPTATTIYSLIKSKKIGTEYRIHVVVVGASSNDVEVLRFFDSDDIEINLIFPDERLIGEKSISVSGNILSASPAALFKFALPLLVPEAARILYIDGDIVVRDDLSGLYSVNMEGCPLAAVADSGQIYYKHSFVRRVKKYLNSGVLLMDCVAFRSLGYTDLLIKTRASLVDSKLMDQDAFNVAFDEKWLPLPIKYNLLWVNLVRAKEKWTVEEVNALYGTKYKGVDEIESDALILHYSSKDKPWRSNGAPLSDVWYAVHNEFAVELHKFRASDVRPDVTVIIPVHNTQEYLTQCLESVLEQSGCTLEVICVSDGSTDESWRVIERYRRLDSRVLVLYQNNAGQSVARNEALRYAQGRFVYFMDSDDVLKPGALEECVKCAETDSLDVVYFDADAFFESEDLRVKHSSYESYYLPKGHFPDVMSGQSAFLALSKIGVYRPAPVLQLIRRDYLEKYSIRFSPGIIHEDNIFSLEVILRANRVRKLSKILYSRRVREGSTMTSAKHARSVRGYIICFAEMMKLAHELELEGSVVESFMRQVKGMIRQAKSAGLRFEKEGLQAECAGEQIFLRALGLFSATSP